MVSTSGSHLLPEHAVETLIQQLLPLSTLLTPNIPEAKVLLQTAGVQFKEPEDVDSIVELAKSIQQLGPRYVLLKGGHLPLTKERMVSKSDNDHKIVMNVLYGNGKATLMETPYLTSKNTHGTGCSLACNQLPLPDFLKTLLMMCSGYCMQSRIGLGYCEGGQEGQQVCRSGHQN